MIWVWMQSVAHCFTVPFQHLLEGIKEGMKTWITKANTVGGI
jgi:hypothetical protein